MTRNNLTVDQIIKIYFLKKDKQLPPQKIAEKMGLKYPQVWSCFRALNRTWSTKKNLHSKDRYVHAVIKIKGILMQRGKEAKQARVSEVKVEQTIEVQTQQQQSSIDKLEQAFSNMEKAITEFVISEVDKEVRGTKLENQELQARVKLLEEKNGELLEFKKLAKESNIFGALRNHFQAK